MRDAFPTYFISHGGGPWPWIDTMRAQFAVLETALARMPEEVGQRPEAVLVISGHWETDAYAVMAGLDGIAFPADGAVSVADAIGREFHQAHACCSIKLGEGGKGVSMLRATSCAA